MKHALSCVFSLLSVICASQEVTEINRKINENSGTFVIRDIRKIKKQNGDSTELSIRFFSGFSQLIKSESPNSVTFFLIDNREYKVGADGRFLVKLKKGLHSISIIRRPNSLYYANFSPIRELKLKLKPKKYYAIDIYLARPLLNNH